MATNAPGIHLNGTLALGAAALPHRVWAKVRDPLRFFVLGDWGRKGGDDQIPIATEMARIATQAGERPAFILTTGDNFYDFGVAGPNDAHWRLSFDDIYPRSALGMPWHPTLGNHDWGGDVAAQVERNDGRWQMKGLWYKLDVADHGHPDVAIYMIDTMIWGIDEDLLFKLNGARVPKSYAPLQEQWLRSELERPGPAVKIVVGHHPVYSVGPHRGAPELSTLDTLMKRTGVSLYISGHDHCLYRIRQGDFHYVCSGGGSQLKADYTGGGSPGCVIPTDCPDPTKPGNRPIWESFLPRTGFASFKVDAREIGFAFHGSNPGEVLERATLPVRRRGAGSRLSLRVRSKR